MFAWQDRFHKLQDVVTHSSSATYLAPYRWEREALAGTRQGRDRLVFTCSLSDFFIEEADRWRPDVWGIMRATPHLTYQVLTKRVERIADHLPADWGTGYRNVWLGTSVENRRFLHRLDVLGQIPAVLRFVSFEPLLEDLDDLAPWLPSLSWAIVGGESGPHRRHMDVAWMTTIVTQCQAAGLAVWVKQDTALREGQQGRIPDELWQQKHWPLALAGEQTVTQLQFALEATP
jgi:protein gp37